MVTRRPRLLLVALTLATAISMTGCTAEQPSDTPQPAPPADNAAPPATPDVSDADGAQLVTEKCGSCHPLQRVEAAQKDRGAWESTVSRMEGHGLDVDTTERAAIVDYLAERDEAR